MGQCADHDERDDAHKHRVDHTSGFVEHAGHESSGVQLVLRKDEWPNEHAGQHEVEMAARDPGSPIAESTLNPERQKRRNEHGPCIGRDQDSFRPARRGPGARARDQAGERIAFWCVDIDGSSIAILQRIIGEFAVKIGVGRGVRRQFPRRRRRMN